MPSFLSFQRGLRWRILQQPHNRLSRQFAPPQALKPWLLDAGSLTAKLIALSKGAFQVRILRQHYARASLSESQALGIAPRSLCLIREVLLMGDGQPWVFARSLLPLSSLTGRLRRLRKQGTQPLGSFLFSQAHLERSPIALSLINRHHGYLPTELIGDRSVWGRRSIFYIDAKPLLVSEVFLPDFPLFLMQPV